MPEITTLALIAVPFVIVAVYVVRAAGARRRAYREWVASLPDESSNRPGAELAAEWKSYQRIEAERYQAESKATAEAPPAVAVLDSYPAAPLAATASVVPGPPRTNTMAILALIFGIGGGLLAIVFGHVALSQISRSGEGGRGLAIAGLVLGYLTAAILLALLVSFLLYLGNRYGWS
jgi:hypothetical protein